MVLLLISNAYQHFPMSTSSLHFLLFIFRTSKFLRTKVATLQWHSSTNHSRIAHVLCRPLPQQRWIVSSPACRCRQEEQAGGSTRREDDDAISSLLHCLVAVKSARVLIETLFLILQQDCLQMETTLKDTTITIRLRQAVPGVWSYISSMTYSCYWRQTRTRWISWMRIMDYLKTRGVKRCKNWCCLLRMHEYNAWSWLASWSKKKWCVRR